MVEKRRRRPKEQSSPEERVRVELQIKDDRYLVHLGLIQGRIHVDQLSLGWETALQVGIQLQRMAAVAAAYHEIPNELWKAKANQARATTDLTIVRALKGAQDLEELRNTGS